MQLIVDPETFEISTSGAVTGAIYFREGASAFPETGWNDLVSPILLDWSREIVQLASEPSGACALHFMDGPFSVRLKKDRGAFFVSFESRPKAPTASVAVDFQELAGSFLKSAAGLISIRDFQRRMPRQAAELRGLSDQLRRVLNGGAPAA